MLPSYIISQQRLNQFLLELYGGFIVVVVREATVDENGVFMKTTNPRKPPMASFRFWFSKSTNNFLGAQQPAQNDPICRSSVIRSAPYTSGDTKREAITKSRYTKSIDNREGESESEGGYDNRKQRYAGFVTDAIVVHNRPIDQSKYGTKRPDISHLWSAAKRQRTEITIETPSNQRACLICNALAPADLRIKDVLTIPREEDDSDEFSDTSVSVIFVTPSYQAVILTARIFSRSLDLLQNKH